MKRPAHAPQRRPLVSVVVVHWNTPDLLRSCLDALAAAGAGIAYETIVIDNGSRPSSRPDLRGRREVKLVSNRTNRGFAAAANQGAALARSPYLLFLNPDAELARGSLACLVDALERDGGLAAVAALAEGEAGEPRFPGMRFLGPFNQALALLGARGGRLYNDDIVNGSALVDVDWARASTLLVRAQLFRALGGFDEGYFFYEEDEDWCWRARRRGYRIAVATDARTRDPGGASTKRAGAWIHTALYLAQRRFIRRRTGCAGELAYRISISAAILLRALSRPPRTGVAPSVVLRSLWKPASARA